jgi:glycine cleavage system H protein
VPRDVIRSSPLPGGAGERRRTALEQERTEEAMHAVIEILQSVGVFFAGLLARFGLFLAMLAVLVGPALAIALVVRGAQARRQRALGMRRVAGVLFRPDLSYAPGHTWLHARKGGRGLELGLDDLAQRLLPSVTAVELPNPGKLVRRGQPIAVLHGGGRAVSIPAPISGTVLGVNAAVLRDPGVVKRDGYGRGWLVAIAPADSEWQKLPRDAEAESFIRRESARWSRFFEDRLGFAAADGGELVAPAPWLVGEEGWKALTAEFLAA